MMSRPFLLAAVACIAFSAPALAADDSAIIKRLDAMERMIAAQQKQIETQKSEISALRRSLARQDPATPTSKPASVTATQPPSAAATRAADQQAEIDALNTKLEAAETRARLDRQEAPVWSFANGRPVVQTPDGRFSLAVRLLGQFDAGYFIQSARASALPAANGPDLSSGTNFRRAQLGIQGKIFGDWSYFANFDFGGAAGNERQGRIQSLYVEYDGVAPFAFRIGAYAPPAGLEDGTASGDTIFLERNSPSDVARNIAGGDGRDAVSILYAGDRVFGALSYTGGKAADTTLYFDEQNALLGRLSGVLHADNDSRLVLSASGTYVFKAGDAAAGPGSARNITLSDPPELAIDDQGIALVSTGPVNAQNVKQWAVEAGGNWRNLYGQAGYFGYAVARRQSPLPDFNFSGWYAEGTWIITGESKGYNTATGVFTPPKPHIPFSPEGGGWGAWELAGRYSDLNLNDRAGVAGSPTPPGGVRGGEQRIWTVGLNWYPNPVIRFALNYEWININRLGTAASPDPFKNQPVGQTLQAVALRSQISF